MEYRSVTEVASAAQPGVVYEIAKVSFGRRLELIQHLRELAPKIEFFQAGETAKDEIEAGLLMAEIDRLYVLWALRGIRGLHIDGEPATPESLLASGPEELFREALEAVKAACSLSEAERKN